MKSFFVCAALLVCMQATADDSQCSVGAGAYGELKFALPSDKTLFTKLEQKKLKKNEVSETATLKSGLTVQIDQNGCSHHVTTVRRTRFTNQGHDRRTQKSQAVLDQARTEF